MIASPASAIASAEAGSRLASALSPGASLGSRCGDDTLPSYWSQFDCSGVTSICGKPREGRHINGGEGGASVSPREVIAPTPAPPVADDVMSVSKEEHSSSSSLCRGQGRAQRVVRGQGKGQGSGSGSGAGAEVGVRVRPLRAPLWVPPRAPLR